MYNDHFGQFPLMPQAPTANLSHKVCHLFVCSQLYLQTCSPFDSLCMCPCTGQWQPTEPYVLHLIFFVDWISSTISSQELSNFLFVEEAKDMKMQQRATQDFVILLNCTAASTEGSFFKEKWSIKIEYSLELNVALVILRCSPSEAQLIFISIVHMGNSVLMIKTEKMVRVWNGNKKKVNLPKSHRWGD